ncbi:MAG: tRNA (guanosine(37)-N1)-methyltransferase TrmD [Fibrobacterales bacterium]|nr:tRNA (guanosine(37)-N1)-methyltransferase TrmD [Fibrobacterales bacterium]
MRIDVVTLFPEMFAALEHSIVGRARRDGHLDLRAVQLRDFAINRYGQVDDYAYGGEPGMVLRPEPLRDALKSIDYPEGTPVVHMTPQGRTFDQPMAEEFAKYDRLVLVCGHYKGLDERIVQKYVTHEVSIGDFVLTGGELAAMAIVDAVIRLKPGVLGDLGSAETDSFSTRRLGWPLYTRPEVFEGLAVPETLKGGNHALIEAWRRREALKRTLERRPDLLEKWPLTPEELRLLEKDC